MAVQPTTRYAKSGDVHIAYQVFGEGPVDLVVAPGFVSHIENYWDEPRCARWLTRLASFSRVIIFDKRGTGLSDQVSDLPAMDERMDDMRAVMDAVGIERAAMMGISEGGSLAAMFAAHQQARCEALILYGAFAKFTSWLPTEESLRQLFAYIESDWGSGTSLPMFAPSLADDLPFQQWWGKFERLGATPGAAIAIMRMNSQIDISDILPSIHVPTLVIHRTEDVTVDVEGGRTLAARIPNARLFELPGADHIPWVGDNTEEYLQEIEEFLTGEKSTPIIDRVLATVLFTDTRLVGVQDALEIAAMANAHAGGLGHLERGLRQLDELRETIDRRRRIAELRGMPMEALLHRHGRHEPGAALGHERRGPGVDHVAMLDRAGADLDAAPHRDGLIGVRHKVGVGRLRFLHHRPQLVEREMGLLDGNTGNHAARGHDLDVIRALAQLLTDRAAHVVDSIDHLGDGARAATGRAAEVQLPAPAEVALATGLA